MLTSQIIQLLRRARGPTDFSEFEEPIRAELFSAERLEQHAHSLALAQTVAPDVAREHLLVPRVQANGRVLHEARKLIGNATRHYVSITPAAEWLLDNFHVVEDQLRDIRDHLPAGYYRKLPKLAQGHLRGYPRVYGLAWATVAHTDSRFDPEWLIRFVRAYQQVQPLTIGELWAVPISLRIVMVENLRRLAVRIVGSQMARQGADKFVDDLPPDPGARPVDLIERAFYNLGSATLWPAFAVQLVQRLRYQAANSTVLLEWLNRVQDAATDDIVQAQHAGQAAANLTVRNLITSMRAIAAHDWRTFFEDVSLVDATLRQHPGFTAMDFLTRDRYRHAIEDLARGSDKTEIEIAARVIAKSEEIAHDLPSHLLSHLPSRLPSDLHSSPAGGSAARNSVGSSAADPAASPVADSSKRQVSSEPGRQDPGFYLIAAGRCELERELGYRRGLRSRCIRVCRKHAAAVYFGAIALLTLAIVAPLVGASVAVDATLAD